MKVELLQITPNSEDLIEKCGRICYQSEPKDECVVGDLIKKLIKSGHHSVLEHASATFLIDGITRACSHQLVRHRLCSFSQKSQRYCREDQFDYVVPNSILQMKDEQVLNNFYLQMEQIQEMYDYWKEIGIKNEDARFVLPNACTTQMAMTANFREYRKIFELRCDRHAQWEIRDLCKELLRQLCINAPNVFGDMRDLYL